MSVSVCLSVCVSVTHTQTKGGGQIVRSGVRPKTLVYRYTSAGYLSSALETLISSVSLVNSQFAVARAGWRPHRVRAISAGFENLSARKVGYRLQHHEHLTHCNRRNAMCHLPAPSFFVPAGTRGLDTMMPVAYCSVLAFWLGFMTSIRVVLFSFSTVLLHVVFSHLLTTLTLHHTFTVSFQAQNSPFPQIFSTRVC